MSAPNPSDRPLKVRVTAGGVLVIEIGVGTLANAAIRSDYAWRLTLAKSQSQSLVWPEELFEVTNAHGLARDIAATMASEAEDGSSLLTDLLDEAFRKAVEDGSGWFVGKDENENEP